MDKQPPFRDPSQMEFGLALKQTQAFGQSLDARRVVAAHVRETNPSYSGLTVAIEQEFADPNPNKKVMLVVAGFAKVGKSRIIEGLTEDLREIFEARQIGDVDTTPRFLYHDFIDSQQIASGMGLTPTQLGQKPPEEYLATAAVDDEIMELFYRLPGRALLIRQIIGFSQNFDTNGRAFGVPRGDLQDIKNRIDHGNTIHFVTVTAPEAFRREKVVLWHELANTPLSQIKAKQQVHGIIDATKNPKTIRARYQTASPFSSNQHVYGMADTIYALRNELLGENVDETDQFFKSTDELHAAIDANPEEVERLQAQAIKRIESALYRAKRTANSWLLRNTPLPKGTVISETPEYLERMSLVRALVSQAHLSPNDYRLKMALERFRLLDFKLP